MRLDEVVLHALEKEPDRRYQHASEVKTDVETIAAVPPRSAATARAETTHPPKSRYALFALILFLAGTLGTLVLMTLSFRHEMALIFGGAALVMALVFGVLARKEALGKGIALATVVLFAGCIITVGVLVIPDAIGSKTKAARLAAEAQRELQRAATLAAQKKAGDQTQSPPATTIAVSNQAPSVVIETFPMSGSADVDPAITELRVTFSKPMLDGSWSWSALDEESAPQTIAGPKYLDDRRTCVLPVRLQPGKIYALWLNSEKFKNFQDRAGQPALPYLLIFQTRK